MARQDSEHDARNADRERKLDRDAERESRLRFLRRDYRKGTRQPASSTAVLDLLTHAGQALAEARELAVDAGLELSSAVIQRAAVVTASAIETLVQPLDTAGVLQPPVPSYPVPRANGGGR